MSELKQRRPNPGSGGDDTTSSNGTTSHQTQQQHHHAPKTLQHQAQEVAAHLKQQLNGKVPKEPPKTPFWVYPLLLGFAAITIATIPRPFHPPHGEQPTIQHVFYYGWLTAMSTGLGALPFLLVPDVKSFWVGISNGTFTTRLLCKWFCNDLCTSLDFINIRQLFVRLWSAPNIFSCQPISSHCCRYDVRGELLSVCRRLHVFGSARYQFYSCRSADGCRSHCRFALYTGDQKLFGSIRGSQNGGLEWDGCP